MPYVPYPVSGTVYDRDGSTLLEGATVILFNCTTKERTSGLTNATGEFMLDLANMPSGYTDDDHLQLSAFYGVNSSGVRSLSKRTICDPLTGTWDIGTMVLHAGDDHLGDCNITFASHTNSHSAGLYVDYFDRDDNFVFRIDTGAATSIAFPIGYLGVKMDGGFIRIFEGETAGYSETLTVWK